MGSILFKALWLATVCVASFASLAGASSAPCQSVEADVFGAGKCSPIYFTTVDCWQYAHDGSGVHLLARACYPTEL